MSTALSKSMSLAEFLEWEDKQEGRHEFDGSRIVEMTGGVGRTSALSPTSSDFWRTPWTRIFLTQSPKCASRLRARSVTRT